MREIDEIKRRLKFMEVLNCVQWILLLLLVMRVNWLIGVFNDFLEQFNAFASGVVDTMEQFNAFAIVVADTFEQFNTFAVGIDDVLEDCVLLLQQLVGSQ